MRKARDGVRGRDGGSRNFKVTRRNSIYLFLLDVMPPSGWAAQSAPILMSCPAPLGNSPSCPNTRQACSELGRAWIDGQRLPRHWRPVFLRRLLSLSWLKTQPSHSSTARSPSVPSLCRGKTGQSEQINREDIFITKQPRSSGCIFEDHEYFTLKWKPLKKNILFQRRLERKKKSDSNGQL